MASGTPGTSAVSGISRVVLAAFDGLLSQVTDTEAILATPIYT